MEFAVSLYKCAALLESVSGGFETFMKRRTVEFNIQ